MSKIAHAWQYRGTLLVGAALALGGVGGCGAGMPRTYPAKGKVVFKGGKPVTDGRIQFQSVSDT
jgi:hypothetical protein